MKYRKYKAKFAGKTFVIKQDLPEIGWFLYVYEDGRNTHDYLQDTREIAMSQAKDDFGVPMNKWIEIEGEEIS